MLISGGGQPSLSSPSGFWANEKSPLKVKTTLRKILVNIQKFLRIDVFPKPLKHQATLSRHSEQNVGEFYNDQYKVRRISDRTRFFALCKDLLGWCKPFAQNDVAALEKGTSYGALKNATILVEGTSTGAMSADNRKNAFMLTESTSYGALSADNPKNAITFVKTSSSNKRKCAFTLAEVLITLGIIGIVAAMTLPTVITNYQKKETVVKLKKVYTLLSQAVEMSEVYNGSCEYWDFTGLAPAEFFNKYLKPYIPTIVNIRYGDIMNEVKYMRPSGIQETSFTPLSSNAMIVALKDGTLLYLDTMVSTGVTRELIFTDINGLRKPNIIGRDFFGFSVTNTKRRVVPYGAFGASDMPMSSFTREAAKSGTYACSKWGRGQFCAALIMIDGWEIKDDYPW